MLVAGTQVGPYEVLGRLGAGGMGEVYRARDKRLERDVAIKVLSAEVANDADRMRRLEQEARAASRLSHPNILVVHDVGTHEGSPYIVSEFLEGETLRERIEQHPLPLRKAIDFSLQLAHGLAAAHDKQIVHRDLKPENLFITKDGRLKILDFGLAKLLPQTIGTVDSNAPTGAGGTVPGMIMGTVGYMSPEQVRGQEADHRSDIFAFGAILYEMLTGKRAFPGATGAEIMAAILKDDPPELSDDSREMDPSLKRIVRHCLEKKPEERFQSASDIGFSLDSLSVAAAGSHQSTEKRRWPVLACLTVAALILGALAGTRISRDRNATLPSYQRLTFNRGTIWNARFTPDGQNVVYSAGWDGRPLDLFGARVGTWESRSLKLDNTDVLAISASNEMLVLRNRQRAGWYVGRGTLARMPVDGGTPREILEDVQQADWAPDGSTIAVVRWVNGQNQLEYPVGKVLYKTAGYISHPRISPKGDLVAFMDHQIQWDDRGWVAVVDRTGKKTVLSGEWQGEEGLAWTPKGDEIWFAATKPGQIDSLYAVTLSGQERPILQTTSKFILHDIARDGRVLITSFDDLTSVMHSTRLGKEMDISLLHVGEPSEISADGKTVLYEYSGEAAGINYAVYLRNIDDPSAVRLGDGASPTLSPDGKWALSVLFTPPGLQLLPTRAGEPRHLERGGIEQYARTSGWFPDGKRIVFQGLEKGRGWRLYSQSIDGGPPQPITPEGTIAIRRGPLVSPDGRWVIVSDTERHVSLYPLAGGASQPLDHLDNDGEIIGWSSNGRSLYFSQNQEMSVQVYRFDPATGRKDLLQEIRPADLAGIWSGPSIFLTPDARDYVYSVRRILSDLYIAQGLK